MKVKVVWNDSELQQGELFVNSTKTQSVALLIATPHQAASVTLDLEQAEKLSKDLELARVAILLTQQAEARAKLKNLRPVKDRTVECCATCRIHKHKICPDIAEVFTSVCDLYKPLYKWPDGSMRTIPFCKGETDAAD